MGKCQSKVCVFFTPPLFVIVGARFIPVESTINNTCRMSASHRLSKGLELMVAEEHSAQPSRGELIQDFCLTYTVDQKTARKL